MRRTSFAAMPCSLARSIELIGDWWNPLILRDLYLGVSRYDELVHNLGISRNLLTRRLADLQRTGLVQRRAYQDHPRRFDYLLSEAGKDLAPVLMALTAWGDRWVAPEGGPPVVFTHRPCRHKTVPTVACSHCRHPIHLDDIAVHPSPAAPPHPGTQ